VRAFEISLNGRRLCLAGIGKDGVLSTTITHVPFRKRRETRLYVGGIVLPQDEHVFWKESILHLGDELRLKVVEKETVDMPRERVRRDPAAETRAQKRYVQKMARKFGWKIQKSRKIKIIRDILTQSSASWSSLENLTPSARLIGKKISRLLRVCRPMPSS
jgi:hypothetical protein